MRESNEGSMSLNIKKLMNTKEENKLRKKMSCNVRAVNDEGGK